MTEWRYHTNDVDEDATSMADENTSSYSLRR